MMQINRKKIAIEALAFLLLLCAKAPLIFAQHEGHGAQTPTPQTEEQPAETPAVEIPHDKQQLIGVRTAVVTTRNIEKTIKTVGRVEYDERKLAAVSIKFEGWIEKLYADYTGKNIKKGDPLVDVYSPELLSTQQELLNTLKWARSTTGSKENAVGGMLSRDAEAIIEAARQRLRFWDITDEQIKSMEETGKTVRAVTIHSPVDGTVVQKNVVQGMRVMPGEKLFEIADLSTVWITADVYEQDLPFINTGGTARVTLSSLPGRTFTAPVEFVYPTLAGETRTVKIRLTVPNSGGRLKPQMLTNVEISSATGRRLVVPEDAVLDTGTRQIVYVDKGDGFFEPRVVALGLRAEGWREVLSGLKKGEKVARSATFLIDSEAQLKGVR